MAVDSVAAGADVLGWCGASALDLDHPDDAALWDDISAVVGELATVKDAVLGSPVGVGAPVGVRVRAHADGDAVVLFVSHRSSQPGSPQLRLPSAVGQVETLSGVTPVADGATLQFDFPAYGTSIVRVR